MQPANTTSLRFSVFKLIILSVLSLLSMVPDEALAEQPVEVTVGLNLHQITGINQRSENFGAVASLVLTWNEPELAASSGEDDQLTRTYQYSSFINLLTERGLSLPTYSFYNLQGRIDYQNRGATIDPAGNIDFFARFTATFQAPDFDFSHFPLDKQNFDLKLDFLNPQNQFVFKVNSEFRIQWSGGCSG